MNNLEQNEKEITIRELLQKFTVWCRFLLSKWKIIFCTCIIGAICGLGYVMIKKPKYKAVITFALEDDKPASSGLSSALGLANSLGIDLGSGAGGAFSGSNLLELLKSRLILEKTLLETYEHNGKTILLANELMEFSGVRERLVSKSLYFKSFSFPINSNRTNFNIQQDSVLMLLYDKLFLDNIVSVSQKDKKISIITVEINSKSELFSHALANNLVKNVSEFYIETKSKKARNNVAILQKQADSVRNELNQAITGVAVVADNTFNLNPALNVNRVPSTKRQVDIQANTAILTQLVTNLELAKVTLLKETPLIQIIDKPIFPLKNDKPVMKVTIIIGSIFGFIISSLFLILKRYWDLVNS